MVALTLLMMMSLIIVASYRHLTMPSRYKTRLQGRFEFLCVKNPITSLVDSSLIVIDGKSSAAVIMIARICFYDESGKTET